MIDAVAPAAVDGRALESAAADPRPRADVAVVTCAYSDDRWSDLEACVHGLRRQAVAPREIVVVIDHNERLFDRASRELSGVSVVSNKGPRGLADARNAGVQASRSSIVAFIDDDAVPDADWVKRLAEAYDDCPDALGVGGELVPEWLSEPPPWFPEEFMWVFGCSYRGMPTSIAPVRNLIGANMSARRSTIEALGGFRTGFGKKGGRAEPEDTDFGVRARQRFPEAPLLYYPAARVHHKVPAERASVRYFVERCIAEGRGKASLVTLVGSDDGLSSERSYVARTLPAGIARGVLDALRGDPHGLARAGAIVLGFTLTCYGYAQGRARTAIENLVRRPG